MPVRNPGVSQHARRVVFEDLAVGLEVRDTVDDNLPGRVSSLEAPAAADPRGHFPELCLAGVLSSPPEHELLWVGQSREDSLRRRSNLDFSNNRILTGRDLS